MKRLLLISVLLLSPSISSASEQIWDCRDFMLMTTAHGGTVIRARQPKNPSASIYLNGKGGGAYYSLHFAPLASVIDKERPTFSFDRYLLNSGLVSASNRQKGKYKEDVQSFTLDTNTGLMWHTVKLEKLFYTKVFSCEIG